VLKNSSTRSAVTITLAGWLALVIAMGIGRFAFTPMLPMMQADRGVSVAAGGWLASANYLGYFVGALGAVYIRIGAVTAIRWSLAFISGVTLAMAVTDNIAAWMILRFLAGVTSAWVLVCASAWTLAKLAALQLSAQSGVVFGGVGAGIALAGMLCLALMSMGLDSSQGWLLMGTVAIALSMTVWPLFGTGDVPVDTARPTADFALHQAASLRLILCYGASGFGYIVPATFLPVMAREIVTDPMLFGWSWPIFGLASVASTLAAGALQRRFGTRRVWLWSHLLMAFGVAAPVFWPGLGGIFVAAILVGGTFIVSVMSAFTQARELAGDRATTLIAAMTACYAIGQLVGPIMVSMLENLGASMSYSLLIAAAVLAASVFGIASQPCNPANSMKGNTS